MERGWILKTGALFYIIFFGSDSRTCIWSASVFTISYQNVARDKKTGATWLDLCLMDLYLRWNFRNILLHESIELCRLYRSVGGRTFTETPTDFCHFLAAIILKEKLTQRFIGLALLAMLGAYLVTFGTTSIADWDDKTLIAALLATLAAFSWGSSTVLGKHALNRLPFTAVTALRLSLTAVCALIIFTVTSDGLGTLELTTHQWRNLVIIVMSTGAVALFIYYFGLKHMKASHATVYELTWPLSAVFLDWIIRGHILGFAQIIGAILLLGSMILLTREETYG